MEGGYDKRDLRSTEERADKCADTEQGDDEAFADDGECAGGRDLRVGAGGETEEEVLHENDVRDLAGIILTMFQNAGPMSVLARRCIQEKREERTPKMNPPIEASTASMMAIQPMGRPSLFGTYIRHIHSLEVAATHT